MISRRLLTGLLYDQLATLGKPVGIANAPKAGGWDGEPNTDGTNFIPYTVLTPGSMTNSSGPMSDSRADLRVPYALSSFGVTPESAEWMGDLGREGLEPLVKTTLSLGDGDYKIQQVAIDIMGGLQRVDATDPPFWGEVDTLTVWLTKELV